MTAVAEALAKAEAEGEAEAEVLAWLMTSAGRHSGLMRYASECGMQQIISTQLGEGGICSRAGLSQQQQHSRAMTLTVALDVAGLEMQLATAEDTALAVALAPAEQQSGLSKTVVGSCLQAGNALLETPIGQIPSTVQHAMCFVAGCSDREVQEAAGNGFCQPRHS